MAIKRQIIWPEGAKESNNRSQAYKVKLSKKIPLSENQQEILKILERLENPSSFAPLEMQELIPSQMYEWCSRITFNYPLPGMENIDLENLDSRAKKQYQKACKAASVIPFSEANVKVNKAFDSLDKWGKIIHDEKRKERINQTNVEGKKVIQLCLITAVKDIEELKFYRQYIEQVIDLGYKIKQHEPIDLVAKVRLNNQDKPKQFLLEYSIDANNDSAEIGLTYLKVSHTSLENIAESIKKQQANPFVKCEDCNHRHSPIRTKNDQRELASYEKELERQIIEYLRK